MKFDKYVVAKQVNRTVISRQDEGKGELHRVQILNVVMNDNDMRRLEGILDEAASRGIVNDAKTSE